MADNPIQNPFAVFQGASSKSATQKSKEDPTEVPVQRANKSGRYRIGAPQRPNIVHDNGHLERVDEDGKTVPVPLRKPTLADHAEKVKWAQAPRLLDSQCPWLAEAAAAYRHFLDGKGANREFSYADYIQEDPGGWRAIVLINEDFINQIQVLAENRERFKVTSEKYDMGAGYNKQYPDDPASGYSGPSTENWLKVIGSHFVWISAEVEIIFDSVAGTDRYRAKVTLHAEDRYNFNRGDNNSDVQRARSRMPVAAST